MPTPPAVPSRPSSAGRPNPASSTGRPAAPAVRPKVDFSKYTDLHITTGLLDERVRVLEKQFETLQMHGLLAGEDCFLLVQREGSEATLVLRGKDSIRVFRTDADPNKKVPLATVLTVDEVRRMVLAAEAKKVAAAAKKG